MSKYFHNKTHEEIFISHININCNYYSPGELHSTYQTFLEHCLQQLHVPLFVQPCHEELLWLEILNQSHLN